MPDGPTRDLGLRDGGGPGGAPLPAGANIGRWRVVRVLGGGGFGEVYEVCDATGARAALKRLHARFVASPEMLARFEREVEVLRRLRHPSIVGLVEAGHVADADAPATRTPYFCMELLAGTDLGQLIARRGRLDADEALAVLEPICDAVALAHEHGVIHRDIKAANVVVCEAPRPGATARVVLLDFGIAKLSDLLAPDLTASRQMVGTPSCMSPEQISGAGRVDARADIYALGCLVFHMLTGRLAFQDPSQTMTQYLHLHARRPAASAAAAVPARIDDVIVRAMAIEPRDRFADPRSLFAAVQAALRESRPFAVPVAVVPCIAVMVAAHAASGGGGALDEAMLDDLEGVLPAAERFLAAHGFQLAIDFGASAVFVARADRIGDPVGLAHALDDQLAARAGRDARVAVGIALERDEARFVGQDIQPGPLLQPAQWGAPEPLVGVWASARVRSAGGHRA